MNKDRKDAKYIKPNDSIHAILPYLMEKRTESEVYINEVIDVTELKKWMDNQSKTIDFKLTYFHVFAAIFSKTIYNRPLLNRFVQGHRLYERKKITVSFIAKDSFKDTASEKVVVIDVNGENNVFDLEKIIIGDVSSTRAQGTNDLDKTLKMLTKMPRCILKIITRIIKKLDYYGKLPESFTKTDSNYATLLISNLGSIKCNSCYHHLNNYGTNSVLITLGTVEEQNGKYFIDIGCTLDERIADGFYFANSIKLIKYIAANPKLLNERIDEVVEYE